MHFLPPPSSRCLFDLVDLIFSKSSILPFSYTFGFYIKMRGSRSIAICLSINNNLFFEFHTIRAFFFPLEEAKSFAFSAIVSRCVFYFKSCCVYLFKFECIQILRLHQKDSTLGRHSVALLYFLFC